MPELSLVVLIAPSGAGKSTFARKHFKPTEVLSSDFCRGLVSDDENDQTASNDAFDLLHYIAAKRLAAGKLTVIDATNVNADSRKPLIDLARKYHVLPVAIVLNLHERVCEERNRDRPDRQFGPHVIRRQRMQLRRSLRGLQREGFRRVCVLNAPEEVDAATIAREPLWNDRRDQCGPFDIIGDVHGCSDELIALLTMLGYATDASTGTWSHPHGRRPIFLGDLCDRGPDTPAVLRLVMGMVAAGTAICVPGNHDIKLMRALRGKNVKIAHGLAQSLEQLAAEPEEFRSQVADFIDGLISHFVLDGGKLVVAHAGMKAEMQGRASGAVREFAQYGETTGETDEFGLPVRHNWAADYRGSALVVYGHTPTPQPEWLNRTINIDSGCVFGGSLTALRYPERELLSVPAARQYAEPKRPFLVAPEAVEALSAQQTQDDVLDLADFLGRRIINTRLLSNVTIREGHTAAALEVLSRFAIDPKWLIYLPPTMSPCATSARPDLLEHPAEAFDYYRREGVARVICEEKHMGSRAVVVVCRDEAAARRRFGVVDDGLGACYTRTGRPFFNDAATHTAVLERTRDAAERSGLWKELDTDWLCLDCELLPWSAKAQALLRDQYAAVGAAATRGLRAATAALEQATGRGLDATALLERTRDRATRTAKYIDAYGRYCWAVNSLDDLKLAPFHLLASEGAARVQRDHVWHMDTLRRLAEADPRLFVATPYIVVDVQDAESESRAAAWWEALTDRGGEGMVVKPLDFIAGSARGAVQPAVKCRGREYLRIIYGPEYDAPEQIARLRTRGLALKRSLALREFALGVEALERFVHHEPLRRVHECVLGVLALESQPVDPRL